VNAAVREADDRSIDDPRHLPRREVRREETPDRTAGGRADGGVGALGSVHGDPIILAT
jgi:hypothetical protein